MLASNPEDSISISMFIQSWSYVLCILFCSITRKNLSPFSKPFLNYFLEILPIDIWLALSHEAFLGEPHYRKFEKLDLHPTPILSKNTACWNNFLDKCSISRIFLKNFKNLFLFPMFSEFFLPLRTPLPSWKTQTWAKEIFFRDTLYEVKSQFFTEFSDDHFNPKIKREKEFSDKDGSRVRD